MTRRTFLKRSSAISALALLPHEAIHAENATPTARRDHAQIAITMDLEMARNFPTWNDTHWDYEKGNLNAEAKNYAVEAARRVKAHGGVIHFFAVGQVFEQDNIDWLKQLRDDGHKIGNHTYDHVYVLAKKPEEIQYKFQRAPWLTRGRPVAEVIRDNVQLCTEAMKARLGISPAGFRTPGGFADGLNGRPDIQEMLRTLGFKWISCKYPAHPYGIAGEPATKSVLDGVLAAQVSAQPFTYPNGLVDLPMSPISDIGAFRNARWKLADFETAVSLALDRAIEHRAVYDLLCHPSVMYPNDPEFRIVELVCAKVKQAGAKARLVDLEMIADGAKA